MGKLDRRSDCPIAFALEIIGDRWTLLVIRDLLLRGKRRFSEMHASPEQIATNVLSDRLKRLEDQGILLRSPDPQDGRKVLYSLTRAGRELAPALLEIIAWGAKHGPDSAAPASFLERMKTDRSGLLDELLAGNDDR